MAERVKVFRGPSVCVGEVTNGGGGRTAGAPHDTHMGKNRRDDKTENREVVWLRETIFCFRGTIHPEGKGWRTSWGMEKVKVKERGGRLLHLPPSRDTCGVHVVPHLRSGECTRCSHPDDSCLKAGRNSFLCPSVAFSSSIPSLHTFFPFKDSPDCASCVLRMQDYRYQ